MINSKNKNVFICLKHIRISMQNIVVHFLCGRCVALPPTVHYINIIYRYIPIDVLILQICVTVYERPLDKCISYRYEKFW